MHPFDVASKTHAHRRYVAPEAQPFQSNNVLNFSQKRLIELLRAGRPSRLKCAKKRIGSDLLCDLLVIRHPESQGIDFVAVLLINPSELCFLPFYSRNKDACMTQCWKAACHGSDSVSAWEDVCDWLQWHPEQKQSSCPR